MVRASEKSSIMANRKLYTGFPTSHQPMFYAAPNFLKMGIKYLNLSLFIQVSTIKDETSAEKFHYIKNQWQSCSTINCLSCGINILAGGSSILLISARKGTDPPLEARAFNTLRLIARQPPTSVTSLRLAHWLASDFNSCINSWINCQTNIYTI